MRYPSDELYYEQVTVSGHTALFTNERIKRDTVPDGWYLYEVRHDCFLASNFPHFHRYDSLKSALYIHAVSKNINTFPKNQGRIRAAIAVKILDFTVMYR